MNIPVIIILFLLFTNLLFGAYLHGKEKDGKHNFWVTLIANLVNFGLLYWAGLFDKL